MLTLEPLGRREVPGVPGRRWCWTIGDTALGGGGGGTVGRIAIGGPATDAAVLLRGEFFRCEPVPVPPGQIDLPSDFLLRAGRDASGPILARAVRSISRWFGASTSFKAEWEGGRQIRVTPASGWSSTSGWSIKCLVHLDSQREACGAIIATRFFLVSLLRQAYRLELPDSIPGAVQIFLVSVILRDAVESYYSV